jgi:maltoporin
MTIFTRTLLGCAVFGCLSPGVTLADDAAITKLEQRLQQLEERVETTYVYDQQPADLTPDVVPPAGVVFSGYARYGTQYQEGDLRFLEVGSTGKAVGRLGNETNGGEFQLARVFQSDSGVLWDIVMMIDHWAYDGWNSSGGVDLKKAYAGVTNVIASKPDMYFWAGRDFHQRPLQNTNDYFWMVHDGQGGGFKNLQLGGAKFDLGLVGEVAYADGGTLGNSSGVFAATTKIHDINIGIGKLDLYGNYGFASNEAPVDKQEERAWIVGASIGLGSSNKLLLRYSDGADNSVFQLQGDQQVVYASFDGNFNYGQPWSVDYLASYKEFGGEAVESKNEYSVIVRPMYSWNAVHSTWFEAGYAMEDYAYNGDVTGWKATISQNMSLGGMPWSRPMLRAYATVGDVEERDGTTQDALNIGLQFEAWW